MKKVKTIKNTRSPKKKSTLHSHTDPKKIRGPLKESGNRLRIAFEDAPDAYYITDIKGTLIDLNRKAEGLFGYKKEELIGKNFLKLNILSMIEIPKAVAILAKNSIGKLTSPEEFKLIKKDGTPANVEISTYPTKINNRKMVLGIARDITERQKSAEKIKELNELRNKFIQVVSHQLRTPLTSIRWNLESFLNESFGKITKEQKDIIRLTLEANTIVINRIRDMLTVLDIEEGRSATINKQQILVNSLLDSVLAEFEKKIKLKNIDLKYNPPKASVPAISIDLEKIREVFEKLIENAIDYTKEKGRISIILDRANSFIRFEITDVGIGIPTAEQSHIFQRFYRGSNAFAMKQDASGIGLYIAKYFIEQHGGKIGFISKEGVGSTFWFKLPVIE